MSTYAFVNKTTGNLDQAIGWSDDRELPSNYPIDTNQEIITLTDAEGADLAIESCYNPNTQTFGPKLQITTDTSRIDHLAGTSANITVTYPDTTAREQCNISIDGQSVAIDIVNGKATFPFSSQVVGYHNLVAASSSHYGKNTIVIEVV